MNIHSTVYSVLVFFSIIVCFAQALSWKWSLSETCSDELESEAILHIKADRNASVFTVGCFSRVKASTSCEHNKFAVILNDATLPDGIHIVCDCGKKFGKPVSGRVCYQELVKHDSSSFFCVHGIRNVSVCQPHEICGGSRSGCVPLASCKNVSNDCTGKNEDDKDCCCYGSFCNGWFEEDKLPPPDQMDNPYFQTTILVVVLAALAVFVLICIVMFLFYRCKRQKRVPLQQPSHATLEMPLLEDPVEEPQKPQRPPPLKFETVEKLEVLSRGQRGTRSVYTAKCDDQIYAVKYFLLSDYSSWDAELKIYSLPLMDHKNLLKFIGYTVGSMAFDASPSDHAIYTEYMPMGSLQDVLRQQEVSWDIFLHIASGMMCGLAYLHSAIPSADPAHAKPPIAHRDFKSRNVLLKEDFTACVADFGLALPFDSGRRTSNCGQVGTLRYMAPEVLDLAVNFSCDAFLRIDVYASGLTLWEIMRRCSKPPELIPSAEYEQPFETQLNEHYPACQNHPTLAEMQDVVFVKRLRPNLPQEPTSSHHVYDMIVTIEQCWDHDSEARPSAGCVYNRIKRIRQNLRSLSSGSETADATEAKLEATRLGVNHSSEPLPKGERDDVFHQLSCPSHMFGAVDIGDRIEPKTNGAPKAFDLV